jgi:DNA ligase (NAD+)
MDIEGFGTRMAQLFVDKRLLKNVTDLYYLDRDEILALEGFAEKATDNLLATIEASKNRPLARIIAALGIRGVGSTVAELLTQHYSSIDELMAATQEELEAIESLGPHTASNIVEWFSRERHRELVENLRQAGVRLAEERRERPAEELTLVSLTFVITGTLPSMSRNEATALIQEHGGKVTGSVSSKTDYLLVGKAPGGTKYRKAQQLGVPMIDEAELMQMMRRTFQVGEGKQLDLMRGP